MTGFLLLSQDDTLQQAIRAQLKYCFNKECAIVANLGAVDMFLRQDVPCLLIADRRVADAGFLTRLQADHPLMALVLLGEALPLPLSAALTLPLSMPRLIIHVEQLLYERLATGGQQVLSLGSKVDFLPGQRLIRYRQEELALTDKENTLLLCLLHQEKQGIPRAQLLEEVWGYSEEISTHTLETHLFRLRSKLRKTFGDHEFISVQQGRYLLIIYP